MTVKNKIMTILTVCFMLSGEILLAASFAKIAQAIGDAQRFDRDLPPATLKTEKTKIEKAVDTFKPNAGSIFTTDEFMNRTAYGISFAKGFTENLDWKKEVGGKILSHKVRLSAIYLPNMESYAKGLGGALSDFDAPEVTKAAYLKTLQVAKGKLSQGDFNDFKGNLAKAVDPNNKLDLAKITDKEINSTLFDVHEAFEKLFKGMQPPCAK